MRVDNRSDREAEYSLHDIFEHTTSVDPATDWSSEQAEATYFVDRWGDDYFSINDLGHVAVHPIRGSLISIDLFEIVEQLKERGVAFPVLLRFQDLLKSRVEHLNEAFNSAIDRFEFEGTYQGVYPVKVNQLREVVEEIVDAGTPFDYGLECGSKSELVATLPYLASRDMMLLCNGCKDDLMYRLILAVQRLGRNVLPIVERADEVDLLDAAARRSETIARYGVRVRLTTSGAGLWSESGGENSKFGLSLAELVALIEREESGDLRGRLRLLHFHLGSQIADIENVKQAVEEAARIYAWLRRRGLDVPYFDIGGGLGISYEAGNPDALGMINYTLGEYADVVVASVKRICDDEGVSHPTIVSESGRAVTAHHSVLVVEVLSNRRKNPPPPVRPSPEAHAALHRMYEIYETLGRDGSRSLGPETATLMAAAGALRDDLANSFRSGRVGVSEKALFEQTYWATCLAAYQAIGDRRGSALPEPLKNLDRQLSDHYLCNFSIFRSMVDHWAIGQRFPIMPIHRLDEPPTRRGVLVDLTCDSDGKVTTFVSPAGDKRYLELHDLRPGEPYYLGLFLMGAYQDIMGDMHNLFGRVTEAHVYLDEAEPGNFYLEELLHGATVEEQLALVQYHPNDLDRRMGDLIRQAVVDGRLRRKEGVKLLNQYRQAFRDLTYLTTDIED